MNNVNKINNEKKVNQTIVVDALEIMFLGEIPFSKEYNEGTKLHFNQNCFIVCHTGNKMFSVISDLYLNNIKIGSLKFLPRKKFFPINYISFKIENFFFYTNEFIDFVEYLTNELKFERVNITHLDVAVDCVNHNLLKFLQNYWNLNLKNDLSTRHKGKVNFDEVGKTTIHWGNQFTDKYIKIYDKTLDLKDHQPQKTEYVQKFWITNKLDYENNIVERFELTLKSRHCKLIDFNLLNDSNYLASIVEVHCNNFFQFERVVKQNTQTKKMVYKDITPIKFELFDTQPIEKYKYVPKHSLRGEKITLKKLYFDYLESKFLSEYRGVETIPDHLKDYDVKNEMIKNLILKYPDLNDFYIDRVKLWKIKFEKENDLFTERLTIKDYLIALQINKDVFNNNIEQVKELISKNEGSTMIKKIFNQVITQDENEIKPEDPNYQNGLIVD